MQFFVVQVDNFADFEINLFLLLNKNYIYGKKYGEILTIVEGVANLVMATPVNHFPGDFPPSSNEITLEIPSASNPLDQPHWSELPYRGRFHQYRGRGRSHSYGPTKRQYHGPSRGSYNNKRGRRSQKDSHEDFGSLYMPSMMVDPWQDLLSEEEEKRFNENFLQRFPGNSNLEVTQTDIVSIAMDQPTSNIDNDTTLLTKPATDYPTASNIEMMTLHSAMDQPTSNIETTDNDDTTLLTKPAMNYPTSNIETIDSAMDQPTSNIMNQQ